jgi:urease alpha subunit
MRLTVAYRLIPTSAITHGISHLVGQVAVGMLADLVLWKPENFGVKPEMVLKSGVIAWAQVGHFAFAFALPIKLHVSDICVFPL